MTESTEPPLTPDEETAREWVKQQLETPEYAAAKPSPFDQFVEDVARWFSDLFTGDGIGGGFGLDPGWIATIAAIIIAILLLVLFGRPRAIATRSQDASAQVFLDDDERTAAQLLDAASRAAASGNFSLAVVEQFRALCRALQDRTLLTLRPGDTAQAAAHRATEVFPQFTGELRTAAAVFDRTRYLDGTASESEYLALRNLCDTLAQTQPTLLPDATGTVA